jgi:hypothetical protein
MDAPLLALPPPRYVTKIRWWLTQAPRRAAQALPRVVLSTLLLSSLFWGGYLTGTGTLEAGALPLTFIQPDGPPDWVRQFASAFCRADASFVVAHLAGKYDGMGETAVRDELDAMRAGSGDCSSVRYLGGLTAADGARQYIYVLDFVGTDHRRSVWFVFTTMAGRVVNIE